MPGSPTTGGAEVTHLADRRRPSRTRWLAVAAALVVGAAVPTALAVQQAQRATEAEQQQQALADLLTDPSAVVVHGDVTGGGAATAVLTDDSALFSATGLPDPGEGNAYQLWVVTTDGAASAGVLADDAGTVRQLTDDFSAGDALAITIEPATGSTQPTTDPLVVLDDRLTATSRPAPGARHPGHPCSARSNSSLPAELVCCSRRVRPQPTSSAPTVVLGRNRRARRRPSSSAVADELDGRP